MSKSIIGSYDGKAISAKYTMFPQKVFLYIDNNLHAQQKMGILSLEGGRKPHISIVYPFNSGNKKIEVYLKSGMVTEKMKICVDGNKIAGDNF